MMITVEIEGDFLNFMRDGHVFYDPAIPAQSEIGRFFRHMDDKAWFAEVKAEVLRLILDALGEAA